MSINGDGTLIRIRVNPPHPEKDPLVCSFPGGLPSALSGGGEGEPPHFLWKQGGQRKNLVGRDGICLYQATEPEHSSSKFCIGVFNKRTRTLTLSQAQHNGSIYSLSQSVPSYQPSLTTAVTAETTATQEFGSAKRKRIQKSQEANRVQLEAVVGSNYLSIASPTLVEEAKDTVVDSTQAWRKAFLPPYNEETEEPQMVYEDCHVMGKEAWDNAADRAAQPNAFDGAFPSIQGLLENHASMSPSHVKCTWLLQQLLVLYHRLRHRKSFVRKDAASDGLTDSFLQRFAKEQMGQGTLRYTLTKPDLDKCALYMLILYFLAHPEGRVGNLLPLCADLKMDVKNATHLLRLAGFTVTKKSVNKKSVHTVVLKTPLTFPATTKRGRR